MRPSSLVLSAALALTLASAASACVDDAWVSSRVGEINDYGVRYREPFVNEMVTNYGAPRPYVVQLLGRPGWRPGDVYYACAFAHSIGRPCAEVAERYERNRAGGWGMVVQSYNINIGSPQYVSFRRGFVGTYGRWGHPIMVDRNERVRWDGRAVGVQRDVRNVSDMRSLHGHAYGAYRNGHAYGLYKSNHGHAYGHDKHGDERGGDKDHDKGNDKGHGKDRDKDHGQK